MRRAAALSAFLLAAFVAAEPSLGTKPDLVVRAPQNTSVIGAWDLVQMVVALVIVFALLKWALPKLVTRMNKKLSTKEGSTITVEESAGFGGGTLQIVSARGRTLLLCVSQTGVTCLADLTDGKKSPEEPAFFELVDKAVVEPVEDKNRLALDRLSRLTG